MWYLSVSLEGIVRLVLRRRRRAHLFDFRPLLSGRRIKQTPIAFTRTNRRPLVAPSGPPTHVDEQLRDSVDDESLRLKLDREAFAQARTVLSGTELELAGRMHRHLQT